MDFVSLRGFRKFWTGFIIVFFAFFVVFPTIYILSYAFTNWDAIQGNVLNNPDMMNTIFGAIAASFEIAAIVTVIDFVVGLPMAWIMVRKKFRGKRFLDTLIDMPLAVPTAALGFSSAIFWAQTSTSSIFSVGITSPFLLVVLLHIVFSYPYMVRSLAAILGEIDETYETAGRTLGASKLTAVRTITLPLFRAGLVTGVILCFARSLSETGGTIIALATLYGHKLTTGDFQTGPTLIGIWKSASTSDPSLVPALAFVSILLIVFALVLLVALKLTIMKVRLPMRKVWPKIEKTLSRGLFPISKDVGSVAFLVIFVLVPSFFIFSYVFTAGSSAGNWGPFWSSLITSFVVAGVVTVIDLLLGIPLALHIAKNRNKTSSQIIDTMVNIPLIVPTAALGFSLGLFWSFFPSIPIILIILAHIAFTYPLVVRNVAGAVEEIDPSFEETARTLGAKPIQSFRKVLYPLIKGSVLAGAIMAFTRSLGETGATLAVVANANTAPVYIVNLVNQKAYYQASLACILLIAVSYLSMLLLRYFTREEVA